jgi:hypothetical protein
MRHDSSVLLPVDVVLVDLALIDLTLTHGEAFPIGIGEAIHAVHALHPLDVARQFALLG